MQYEVKGSNGKSRKSHPEAMKIIKAHKGDAVDTHISRQTHGQINPCRQKAGKKDEKRNSCRLSVAN